MKVGDLIKALQGYEDFDIALAFEKPSSTFPDITITTNVVVWDVSYSGKKIVLGPRGLEEEQSCEGFYGT